VLPAVNTIKTLSVISGVLCDVAEICSLLGHYVASSGTRFLLRLLTPEDGTDTLSRNVGKLLPLDAV
jgi:hypothetical protein